MSDSILDICAFRAFDPETDYNFVLSSWAHSFKGSPWAGVCPNNLWHPQMKETLDQLLERGATVLMAVADDDTDHLIGYVCYETGLSGVAVIHYVFVKDEFRTGGMGKALLSIAANGKFIYTFRTPDGKSLERGGTHVPAIARRKKLEPVYVK